MEPLTAGAIATLVLTKTFEKTGVKLGENVIEQGSKLMKLLQRKSPDTASAIELVAQRPELAEQQPEIYAVPVLAKKVEAIANNDPEIGQAVQAVANSDVASSLNNLAFLYESQGRYSEAEPLYLQSLELRQQLLGNDHSEVATSLNNLAFLYKSQGRYSEAEPLYLQALEFSERVLGVNHPNTINTRENLALLQTKKGANNS